MLPHVCSDNHRPYSSIPESVRGLYSTVTYCLGGHSSSLEIGRIMTTRWSEGFPLFSSFMMGGFVTGSQYSLHIVVMIGSNIASGFSLVGTFTTCFRFGDRDKMGDKFNLLVSPAMMNWRFDPYFVSKIL